MTKGRGGWIVEYNKPTDNFKSMKKSDSKHMKILSSDVIFDSLDSSYAILSQKKSQLVRNRILTVGFGSALYVTYNPVHNSG